ncbi:hypothetical protein U1Q18_031977 [Sarracenia purpurea var. burkii]
MPSLPSPGKILRLELENFKSYKGLQTIGPFKNFTAIIGPNGAGKSNLMDAISFVLGVRTRKLRASQLKDLIYESDSDSDCDGREKEQGERRAFVQLLYELGNRAELQFTRSITSSGGSEYRIDGRVVNWHEYNAKLKSLGILVEPCNFLVFQGDVESIAPKNPRELTALIEQISGSDELKGDYENLEEQKARVEEHIRLQDQLQRELVKLKEEMPRIHSKISSSEKDLKKKKKERKKHTDEINKLQNDLHELTKRLDVLNEKVQDGGEKLHLADSRLDTYHQMLEYEQKRDMDSSITKLESSIGALRNDLNEVIAKEAELKSGFGRARDINLLKEKVKKWKSKSEECEKDIQEWEKMSNATTSISKHNCQLKSKLNSRKKEILEKCEQESIILPTISDPMDTGSSTPNPVLDFSQLSRSLKRNRRSSQREKVDVDFTEKIGALTSKIERTAPNLKALGQYEAVLEKERGVMEELKAAQKEIADKYNSVKQRRYELFKKAFDHISGNIDKIYKQLTKSDRYQLGGTAYLNLDNEDEPFLHGIKYYTALPPTKRFSDMEQASSGEKTVASLALLFSIHSYRPSPFFILDEVDRRLDQKNAANVAGFIRSMSCGGAWGNQDLEGGSGFQSIVISHKNIFYAKAEALVEVYMDSEAM